MKNFIYIFLLTLTFESLSISSFESVNEKIIKGELLNDESGLPVQGANLKIENTALGSLSDRFGHFSIVINLQNQIYDLVITSVGYETRHEKIEFDYKTDTIYLKIKLHENVYKTSEIVVSANKQVQALQDVPISVSIIDTRQISARNNTLIDDALKYVPGVVVNQQNISIRGTSGFAFGLGSRVAMLIDGFPVLSGDNGDIKYDIFPVNQIDRIEIVKGAGSALYGTAAIGGVVNIISKEPSNKPAYGFRLFSGFYTLPPYAQWRYRRKLPFKSGLELNYSQSLNGISFLLSGQLTRDESYHNYNDYSKFNLFGKIKYSMTEFTSLSVMANISTDYTTDWVYWNSLDSATIPPSKTDKNIRIHSDKYFAAAELKNIFSNSLFSTLKVGFLDTKFKNTFPQDNSDYRQSDAGSLFSELLVNQNWTDKLNFTYGLNFSLNTVHSATYGDHNQQIYATYLQSEINYLSGLIITAGARFDMERIGNTSENFLLSPKIGFNYALDEMTRLRISAGRGFRAPNIAEKFASVNFQGFKVVQNLNLKPEKSWSAEIGINRQFELQSLNIKLDAVTFINQMFDLIEPTFDISIPLAPIKFMNITKARIIGGEISFESIYNEWLNLKSALTVMDPVDQTLNELLKYRNRFIWYNSIGFDFRIIELQCDYRYMSRVGNIDKNLGLQIKDYDARVPIHIVDARLIVKLENLINSPIHCSINIKNLLNYLYTEIPGNLGATRHISLQLEGSF